MATGDYTTDRAETPAEQCQAIISGSRQCLNKKCDESDYCLAHGGNKNKSREEIYQYKIERFKIRSREIIGNDGFLNLTEELALLRVLIEERVNLINVDDPLSLAMHSNSISAMIMNVEKVLASIDKMQTKAGNFLSKSTLIQFASEFVQIINEHVDDNSVKEVIGNKVLDLLQRTKDLNN